MPAASWRQATVTATDQAQFQIGLAVAQDEIQHDALFGAVRPLHLLAQTGDIRMDVTVEHKETATPTDDLSQHLRQQVGYLR
ncbi:hypothetical protein SAMN05192583_2293 [Sphingomonas gellani]|uniref:Uncharacterized protein n=1 Tax=Sphingomonas gellani TaxID=1166340 RepID=A0A1H8ESP3_9SPHN|nr:hypothetical protein SAMN05192583_2293 [Sphingomonas gellani]